MRAIFVVGTGRSGTHFTVRLLNGFERANDPLNGKENPAVLRDIATAAIHHKVPSEATRQYYQTMLSQTPGIFLDQHHPNLFFARHWDKLFGDIVFLYLDRPICQIVASVLQHTGVMKWYSYAREWRQRTIRRVPFPNDFFGLHDAAQISVLPPHLLCAHRVIAHRKAYERALGPMKGALRAIRYEALVTDPVAEFSRVFTSEETARLGPFSLVEHPDAASLGKFREILSDAEIAEILELERKAFAPSN